MKKQSNLSRLMGYARGHKILTYLSWVLSVMSALLALIPFWYIWRIIHDILEVSPDFSQAENVTGYGWSAVLFAVISIVVYITALMCSHLSAFRVAANIRKELMRHITALPLGVTEKYGSGKLRRIVNSSSAATETYLAHRLPDKAGAIATPIGLLFLLLAFDWRLGLLSLVPVVLGFLIMMKMTGKNMEQKMEQYQNALSDMSNEAVEYVRGVPVVKTFGQTIFSFKRFKNAIDNYETWVIAYTKGLRLPMMFYTTAINGVFAFLIAGGILFTRSGVTNELLLNLIFYIVITPVIGTTLTKIMFMSEDAMIVGDAINRIDEVLNEKPLSESSVNNIPKDNGITLEHVSYSYDGEKNALNDVSLSIKPGQTVALVGASGGGKTTLANIAKYEDILNNYDSMAQVIIDDLDALKKEYAVKRKTKIENAEEAVFEENKVQEQEVVLLMDRFGYAKTVDGSVYERNREAADKENKYILRCMNTGKLCLFTSDGKMHQIKVMDLPYGKFRDKGFPIDNVSNFDSTKEEIVYLCDDRELFFSKFLFVTKQGMIKKVAGSEFQVTKRTIAATKLQDEDALVSIRPIRDVQDVVLMTENGFVLRFPAEEVSEKKKGAVGVRGMKLQKNDSVEEVYLFEEGTESKVIFHEKEVTLNRLKRAKRDGTGTRMRK